MIRPTVGTDLKQVAEADLLYVVGTEFRDDHGIYWRRDEDGLCHAINGGGPVWKLPRVLDASTGPVIVTYVPPLPSPHARPGIYVCSEQCGYRFERNESDLWQGPWRAEGSCVRRGRPMMRWEELEEAYGDCSRNLVGPVPTIFLKGY